MSETKQKSCLDRVQENWASRRDDLDRLIHANPQADDCYSRDGVILCDDCLPPEAESQEWEVADRPAVCEECGHDSPDEDGALEDLGPFHEYGLSLDYVEPGTFNDQPEGYLRFQLSRGGPSDEIRWYLGPNFQPYRADYWFMDWFDGASIGVGSDEVVQAVFDWFHECGSVEAAYREATES